AGSAFATSPVVVFDSNGNSLVAWEQGDGAHYHIYFSRLASGTTSWSAPVQVDAAAADATAARLAADAHGNVIATWEQSELSQGNFVDRIWSSTYASTAAWGIPVLIGDEPGSRAGNGNLVSNGTGIAQALWEQTDGSIWTNRYTPGSGWGTAKLLNPGGGFGAMSALAMDQNGNVLALWQAAAMQDAHI